MKVINGVVEVEQINEYLILGYCTNPKKLKVAGMK